MLTKSSGSMTPFKASRTLSSAIAMALPLVAIILPRQGPRLIVGKPDQDLLAQKLHVVGLRCLRCRHRNSRTGLHVELGPMPRTGDCPLLWIKRPIAQWP